MVNNFQVDTGCHAITGLIDGPLNWLINNYFDYMPVFLDYGDYYVRTPSGIKKIPSNIKDFVTFDVLLRRDRLLLSQAIAKALTLSTFGIDLSKKSIYECLPKNLSKDSYDFVNTIAYFLSGKSMKETSVHRLLAGSDFVQESINLNESLKSLKLATNFSKLATNNISYKQAYPKRGLKTILNSILYSLPENVEIKTNSWVKNIERKQRKMEVSTEENTYYGKNVVYSGFAKDLPKIIDNLPKSYVENLNKIEQTKSLTIWIGLKQKLEYFNYIGSEIYFKNKAYWAMPISNYGEGIAPKGKQLVGFTFVLDHTKSIEEEKKSAYNTILNVFPDLEKYIEMIHCQVTIPEKAAVTLKGYIPDVETPVKNLYLVGTDADKRSMG
ncbi:MAG: NAD(P)/FAD-dependent oxidoreductase, partial [Methanosarcinales archaeon]